MKGGMKDPGMKGGMYEKRKGKIDTWMQEGREERKHEKKEGSIPQVSEKGPKNPTSTPESTKKGAEIDQHGAKIDPKGSQNEAKTDKKSEQRLQDDLGPLWGGDFPAIAPQLGSLLESKIEAKIVKKLMQKIVDFLIGLGSEKSQKKGAKTTPKWRPR